MAPPLEEDILELHGLFFLYDADDDEVWLWEERAQVWAVLPERPSYLDVVNGRLSVIDLRPKKPKKSKCDCERFVVVNFGCKCGGD